MSVGRRILIWVSGTTLFGFTIYGLWYLHNDHPFVAAMLGGFVYMVQLRLVGKVADMLCKDRTAKVLASMHQYEDADGVCTLCNRLAEDEQILHEMEAPEDDKPWGV